MKKKDLEEIRSTESKLMLILVIAVLLLVVGEVVLYRNIQSVKTMISETAMQVKEEKVTKPTVNPSGMMRQGGTQK